ncbi:MAG: diaminobutyrate acetyltransferase [Myxococcota bacterium]|nr:diaminobutyrate acetyltransferase [Myxococcota bacterium]
MDRERQDASQTATRALAAAPAADAAPPTTPSSPSASGTEDRPGDVEVRTPRPEDARDVTELVRRVAKLDANSPYAYLLLCSHFADTGLVRREGGRLVAFVLGYRPPGRPDTYFLWQVGVDPACRGRGLAGRMVIDLLRRLEPRGVRFLEATVTPSNEPSAALFRGVARRLEAPCEERTYFDKDLFPPGDAHEDEVLFRVGPWEPAAPSPTPSEETRR